MITDPSQMLWNWYTVDTCFLSSSWHNTSSGMFAGSCIGVIILVVVLEALRRAGKEYDRYIVAQHAESLASTTGGFRSSVSSDNGNGMSKAPRSTTLPACVPMAATQRFRPSVLQQAIRALLHMLYVHISYVMHTSEPPCTSSILVFSRHHYTQPFRDLTRADSSSC